MDRSLMLEDAAHKLVQATVVAASPTLITDGVAVDPWLNGRYNNRRAVIRLTATVALNLTAISLWSYFDGKWSRLALMTPIADVAFVAGGLVVSIIVTEVIGSRLAVTGTPSTGAVAAEMYTLETVTN